VSRLHQRWTAPALLGEAGGGGEREGGRVTKFAVLTPEELKELMREAVREALAERQEDDDPWLDTRAAAEYAGVHPDTLRKAAAERRIDFDQEAAGHKLYFRRSVLDRWRSG
jgi:predicted alpha/beta hydrolase